MVGLEVGKHGERHPKEADRLSGVEAGGEGGVRRPGSSVAFPCRLGPLLKVGEGGVEVEEEDEDGKDERDGKERGRGGIRGRGGGRERRGGLDCCKPEGRPRQEASSKQGEDTRLQPPPPGEETPSFGREEEDEDEGEEEGDGTDCEGEERRHLFFSFMLFEEGGIHVVVELF